MAVARFGISRQHPQGGATNRSSLLIVSHEVFLDFAVTTSGAQPSFSACLLV